MSDSGPDPGIDKSQSELRSQSSLKTWLKTLSYPNVKKEAPIINLAPK